MKRTSPCLWLAGCSLCWMVIFPTISHLLEWYARRTFSPLPWFFWDLFTHLALGAVAAGMAVTLWNTAPSPALLLLEGVAWGYTLFSLFYNAMGGWNAYSPDYPMRALFLGLLTVLTIRSLFLFRRRGWRG